MTKQIYNWKRFWVAKGSTYQIAQDGFLEDPESRLGRLLDLNARSLESIAGTPCLALLGEPGLGKTMSLEREVKDLEDQIKGKRGEILWLNLGLYGDESRLIRDLFESESFQSWLKGSHILHIFLDSLDECRMQIKAVAAILAEELKKYHADRLFLRIACRTFEWPQTLEDELKSHWGEDAFAAYELLPLRQVDVEEAVKANSKDPQAFLEEVYRLGIVPLARKPITLRFLLDSYLDTGSLPPTQKELYSKGCRLLCKEPQERRREAGLTGKFSADQRFAVAGRIAAITLLSKRNIICKDEALDDGLLTIEDLTGGKETANGNEFEVNEIAIKETLGTGLFTARGPGMGWEHQTYAEFLAARYVVEHQMPLSQIMSLIVHSDDPDGKLIPQLHGLAAWLSAMSPAIFQKVIETDPEALLQSDVMTMGNDNASRLVEVLLKLYDEGKLLNRFSDRGFYKKLDHPGLAEQLRPYITDKNRRLDAREVAIDIARACKVRDLQTDLANVALDAADSEDVRVPAAYAVVDIADEETKGRLKPLAFGQAGPDPYDRLKGCGLRAVWPSHMTAKELFSALHQPKRASHSGWYQIFISGDILNPLNPPDFVEALDWVERQTSRGQVSSSFRRLVDSIMIRAWQNLDLRDLAEPYARIVFSMLRHYDKIVSGPSPLDDPIDSSPTASLEELITSDDEKRRGVLNALVSLISNTNEVFFLVPHRNPFLLSEDVPWMIDQLECEGNEFRKSVWVKLISWMFDWRDPDQVNIIYEATERIPILARDFSQFFRAVDLDSEEAQEEREKHKKIREQQERSQSPRVIDPPPIEQIKSFLDKCEAEDSKLWWYICDLMTLEPTSEYYRDRMESNLKILPGWKATDPITQSRLMELAKRYIVDQEPETEKWLGANTDYLPALAGYKALRLLLDEAPAFLDSISAEVWKKWTPVILTYQISNTEEEGRKEERKSNEYFVRLAYRSDPEGFIKMLMLLIDKGIAELHRVRCCWDKRLAKTLLDKATDESLKPSQVGAILRCLLKNESQKARDFAESLVFALPYLSDEQREKAIEAAIALLTCEKDTVWHIVWPAIQKDTAFGCEVVQGISHQEGRTHSLTEVLTEEELADLYIWLEHQYPHSNDPNYEGAYFVSPIDSVRTWRNSLLEQIKNRSSYRACEAIRRIAREFPSLEWLKIIFMDAQALARRNTWNPPSPKDILKLASNPELRWIENGDQLLEVVIETLRKLNDDLQGKTPAAFDLWNEVTWNQVGKHAAWLLEQLKIEHQKESFSNKSLKEAISRKVFNDPVYMPKDENNLSDYIQRYLCANLKGRGIVINREVEIRPGERTDIHIDAVPKGKDELGDIITVIVEVKGSWNDKLRKDMEAQLLDRYMKNNRCKHGLYIVGWFYCPQWSDRDSRKKHARKATVAEAQEQFDLQATDLSQGDIRIKSFIIDAALPKERDTQDRK